MPCDGGIRFRFFNVLSEVGTRSAWAFLRCFEFRASGVWKGGVARIGAGVREGFGHDFQWLGLHNHIKVSFFRIPSTKIRAGSLPVSHQLAAQGGRRCDRHCWLLRRTWRLPRPRITPAEWRAHSCAYRLRLWSVHLRRLLLQILERQVPEHIIRRLFLH
jgi:hypothetical protein